MLATATASEGVERSALALAVLLSLPSRVETAEAAAAWEARVMVNESLTLAASIRRRTAEAVTPTSAAILAVMSAWIAGV